MAIEKILSESDGAFHNGCHCSNDEEPGDTDGSDS
jgi:hypothetical protein